MQNNNFLQEKDEQPILSLIQRIKDGTVAPETLSKDLRQRCVEVLLGEGYTVAMMAQVLKRSDKTIKRDIEDIRERNAITPDINLAKKIIGETLMYARIHRDYLMKLARTREASVSEKAQAEYLAFKVLSELVGKLQSLGYLPLRPQEITGDFFHHCDNQNLEKSYEDVRKALNEVIDVANQCGNLTPELEKTVDALQKKIEKAEIVQQSEKLLKEQTNENKED